MCHCVKCGRSIDPNNRSYLVGDDPSTIYCPHCVNSIYSEDQKQKDKKITKYPNNEPIYLGKNHRCRNVVYEKVPYLFFKNGKRKKVYLYNCPICGRNFLPLDEFREHAYYLEDNKLISTDTGKPYVPYKIPESYMPGKKYYHDKMEMPESLQWAAKHPYQGGGFSGK